MLTAAQREARKGKLTGSRIKCLMTGAKQDIMNLYLEMIGERAEDDLSMVWDVQRGEATETINLNRYEWKKSTRLTRRGEVCVHPRHDCFAVTLDGWDENRMCPVECKDIGGREPFEVVVERYQPQLHLAMSCTNSIECALSVIIGGREPVVEYIDMDFEYGAELLRRGLQFMDAVRAKRPPVVLPAVPPPVSQWREYNMAGNDQWRRFAEQWLQTIGAVDACKEAEKVLKSLVPEDARKCFACGVRITRNRAGALSLRQDDE